MWRTEYPQRVMTAAMCLPLLLALGCQSTIHKGPRAAQRCLSEDPRYTPIDADSRQPNPMKAGEACQHEREHGVSRVDR